MTRSARILLLAAAGLIAAALLLPPQAAAAKYAVAQCGWHVGNDADWSDTTGGAKFRPDSYCVTPPSADPFDGTHMKSFTKEGAGTVSGTRFARWRWTAPPGTGIVNVRATWWHALHDGIEHRVGTGTGNGGFDVFASDDATNTELRDFAVGFANPRPTLESRLLCARPEDRSCSLDPQSFSAIRALTITLQDDAAPATGIFGDLTAAGWQRGPRSLAFLATDSGGGLRFAETLVDGARVALTEHACEKAMIGGEWRATRMRPCATSASGTQVVQTAQISDGPHSLQHCAEDFAGNRTCTAPRTIYTDNTAPASPRELGVAGTQGWRRANGFDVTWIDPAQGPASPISSASFRVTGPAGYDSGIHQASGDGIASLAGLQVPGPGAYRLAVWLRDAAGNEDAGSAAAVDLLFDDVPPTVAFSDSQDPEQPELVSAAVTDSHAGVAGGRILYRRRGTERWVAMPTELRADGYQRLVAHFPSDKVPPGIYALRAEVEDAAGNSAATESRADGSPMTLRAPLKEKTRIFSRLRYRRHGGERVAVPFGARPWLTGRLVAADGEGIAARELLVALRPGRGSFARARTIPVTTGPHGGFRLRLGPGPSRRVRVSFAGTPALAAATGRPLKLRVRGGVSLRLQTATLHTGEWLRMRGRVRTRGTAVPRRGKLVSIQYYEQGARRWRPVLVLRSDHAGRFHARYRFRYITGTARIRLRAVAPPEERWPYAAGASAPAVVRVSG